MMKGGGSVPLLLLLPVPGTATKPDIQISKISQDFRGFPDFQKFEGVVVSSPPADAVALIVVITGAQASSMHATM